MMTQEENMDLIRLRGEGLTWAEISERLGYHPATLSKWFREGGPPVQRSFDDEHRVLDARWRARIDEILTAKPRLLATSVHAILAAENFGGSYPTVARYVNVVRGPRFRVAAAVSVPIETGPGEEGQFDWTDCNDWAERWGWTGELVCFGAVLCWSRLVWWWFADSLDRQHTFEGLARFFEHVGGVPTMMRTDRMGALGRSQGRRFSLHPPTLEFATAHGIEITACQSRDAKRKGKIERPFRPLKEAFLEELDLAGAPVTIDELNQRAQRWLTTRVWPRAHRTTGIPPIERLALELPHLKSLPRRRFDTAYVEARRVHRALPLIEWHGVRYSVPPACLGQRVEVRRDLGDDRIVVRWANTIVAAHRIAVPGVREVWDPEHRRAAEHAALAPHRAHLRVVDGTSDVETAENGAQRPRLELIGGDYDVPAPDLDRYNFGEHA